ncbi:TetR/AcrR family transcriptional regulator [Mycobacterium sp.]|uniref:TetR/AcrR family transcriptional regulator n=1 Tax=Mycobacterium sp. TaxID=1785 RepID=UPI002CF2472A|nr:TetR/AcrR family transcriptional regulator [Mycobacterium sp.]HME47628.1 TetR/AcrR family transcriptional regulator [Mycobacterium sp.]
MVTSAPPAHAAQARRGRRSSRPSGDDREAAILQTAERLLAERLLSEISVDDLAKGAGISRPTFYFYFPSKDAVMLTLLDRVAHEVDSEIGELQERLRADPVRGWRVAINGFFEAFGTRRWVTRAGAAAMRTQPEVRQIWLSLMQKWIDQTAALITAERKRGAAPETIPAKDLAISLNLMNERAMLAAFAGEQPAVEHDRVVDALTHIWLNSIYGAARP